MVSKLKTSSSPQVASYDLPQLKSVAGQPHAQDSENHRSYQRDPADVGQTPECETDSTMHDVYDVSDGKFDILPDRAQG